MGTNKEAPEGVVEAQRERLRRTIEWARKVEIHLADVREQRLGQVHFRPSSTGISMVGLLPERPQRGKSGISNLSRLAANFDSEFRAHCVDCPHGRPTPEKRLQSHLLSGAYRAERRLLPLMQQDPEPPLLFITDELSLPGDDGRIVCDLLALRGDRPVVIELKPARLMTRLVQQVTDYSALVERHLDLFSELYSAVLGRPVALRSPCERWIVWPHLPGHERDPQENALAAVGVRVVGYTETADRFEFKVGKRLDT